MFKFNEEQEAIINAPESKIIVQACPGSGKTTCLVARLNRLLSDPAIDPASIVAIAFTNNAVDTIRQRLGARANGVMICTIHSYANHLLTMKGIDTQLYIQQEDFNSLFKLVKENPHCLKPVKYLLWDEGQDQTDNYFDFLLNLVKPENWTIFADVRQSIYQFNDAKPERIIELSKRDDVTTYTLNKNYRCDKKILSYAKGIIRLAGVDYLDNSIPVSEVDGKVIESEYEPVQLARYIKMMGNYKNWFVLTRTNEQLNELLMYLKTEGVPYDTFKRAELNTAQLNAKMNEDTVKVLTIHSAKGLEADNVVVIGAHMYTLSEKCIAYVAATRAKHLLIWLRMPTKPRRMKKTVSWER